jgi:acyl carrier protein
MSQRCRPPHERNTDLWREVNTRASLGGRTRRQGLGARDAPGSSAAQRSIDNLSPMSILTAAFSRSDRHAPAGVSARTSAFHDFNTMSDSNARSVEDRIAVIVQRLIAEHSIDHVAGLDEDLRQAGLSSLDMVTLVLSVEEEFDLMVPEASIMPANFRSIATISRLIASLQANP